MDATTAMALAAENCRRIALLGQWPAWIAPESLLSRIPTPGCDGIGGFDAGVACALDLIPRNAQRLAACLHAAYTPAAVAQVRAELAELSPDADTAWWLAACSVCQEGPATVESFEAQLVDFASLALSPPRRLAAAVSTAAEMRSSYSEHHGVALATRDGGMQGAYIDGAELAGAYDEDHDLWFLGTFHPSLGLEAFTWARPADPGAADPEARLGRSGPVHGSRQYVKCADEAEFTAAVAVARRHLGA